VVRRRPPVGGRFDDCPQTVGTRFYVAAASGIMAYPAKGAKRRLRGLVGDGERAGGSMTLCTSGYHWTSDRGGSLIRLLARPLSGVALSLNNLAPVVHDLGELAAARDRLERALTISEAGPDHPNLVTVRENLAEVLAALGA
jgi:hypothetical protein